MPPRIVGEIVLRGPTVMKGYWRNPDATRAAFTPDGWLRTGDAAYMDEDGFVYVHDRVKDMIVSGGENVYPAEVENALYGHPAIADVAVIGVPDDRWGEAVKAVIVLRPGASASAEDIVAYARAHRGLRAAKIDRLDRHATAQPDRQAAQARAARSILGRAHAAGRLMAATRTASVPSRQVRSHQLPWSVWLNRQ